MDCPGFCRYTCLDFVFAVVGVFAYLFDVGSDLSVAAEFYLHGDFAWFGLVIGLMVLSSTVVHLFSWFWFKYDQELEDFKSQTSAERLLFGGGGRLELLHGFQLGFLLRHVSAIEQGFGVWWWGEQASYAAYVTHDLSMLRLLEAFCESAPQLTLLLYIILRTGHARTMQSVSVCASSFSVAWTVVMYHRSLRRFLPQKAQQRWGASAVYFLWNLLLITPRLAALALFASALPCPAPAHFLCLWPALFLWAWLQRTSFMDSAGGEWLYRGAVATIWYFSWFNVAEGRSRGRGLIYHGLMMTDSGILLGAWWGLRGAGLQQAYAVGVVIALPSAYLLGLLLKGLYYAYLHPKLRPLPAGEVPKLRPLPAGEVPKLCPLPAGEGPKLRPLPAREEDVPDGDTPFRSHPPQPGPSPSKLCNQRMARLASIFYTPLPVLPYARQPIRASPNGII
ncbi:XK-related protein 8-like [Conger conger]|uniref:XK-related protein 8-like n=1 Tax=Conger conger TaxID=82655 RepID=UPI002A5A7180|nr:XK-related protein 8-like [Conger conger]